MKKFSIPFVVLSFFFAVNFAPSAEAERIQVHHENDRLEDRLRYCHDGCLRGHEAFAFNVFVKEDIRLAMSDVEGLVAVGGLARFYTHTIGHMLKTEADRCLDWSLVVGGDLAYNASRPYRSVFYGKTAYMGERVYRRGMATFDGGAHKVKRSKATEIIINVTGKDVKLHNFAFFPQRVDHLGNKRLRFSAQKILWNFYEAEEIAHQYIAWEGSILAPKAKVMMNSGVLYGQLFARSVNHAVPSYSAQINKEHFLGCLRVLEQ